MGCCQAEVSTSLTDFAVFYFLPKMKLKISLFFLIVFIIFSFLHRETYSVFFCVLLDKMILYFMSQNLLSTKFTEIVLPKKMMEKSLFPGNYIFKKEMRNLMTTYAIMANTP